MPAILEKRISDSSVPSPKKAKLSTIQTKIQEVVASLSSDDFQMAGSNSNRQMLLALAPCILETPRDSRHPNQEELGGFLKQVFLTEDARLKETVQETQAKIDASGAEMASHKAAVDVATADVEKKHAELKAKMSVLAADVGKARAAKEALDTTLSDLKSQQELKELYEEEQQDVAAKVESFASFKDGTWEGDEAPKDQIKVLGSLFKKLKADASLVAAVPMALGRKPDERSEFDSMTVTELEKKLTTKVEELASKLKEIETALSSQAAEKEVNESTLTAAQKKQREGAEAILQTRHEHKDLTVVLGKKSDQVVEGQIEHKALEAEHLQSKSAVEIHDGVQGKFIELLERQTAEPEA